MHIRLPAPALEKLMVMLQECRQSKNFNQAKSLHSYMRTHRLESHPVLGNYLVPMLVDCGGLLAARHVFDGLSYRNEYSWTSIIQGYIGHGDVQHAFQLYHKMQLEASTQPDRCTYLTLLNGCASVKDVELGHCVHADIITRGLEMDLSNGSAVMGNTLVSVYGRCGSHAEAQHVFDHLPVQNAVSWAALVAGYAEYGINEKAANCIQQMQIKGIAPDSVTLVCNLKACGVTGSLQTGWQMHTEIIKRGFEEELHVGSALVDMYVKSGSLVEAHQVFDRLPNHDAVSWAALFAGSAGFKHPEEVKNYLRQMHLEDIAPDCVTFVCSLKVCDSPGALGLGHELHTEIVMRGLEKDIYIGSALMDMYMKCGSLGEAHQVLDRLPVRDVVAWNTLISRYSEQGLAEQVSNCIHQMQLDGVSPDSVTVVCGLKACSTMQAVEVGQEAHGDIIKWGLEKELNVGSTLVETYCKFSMFADAWQVFDGLQVQDAEAWNALIAGYVEHGLCEKAANCFKQMQVVGTSPDSATFIYSLKACGILGTPEPGWELHAEIMKRALESDVHVGNMLIDMYARCGCLAEARQVFDKLQVHDAASWATLIAGYIGHGYDEEVLNCFNQIRLEGAFADAVILVVCLKACGTIGAIEAGREIHAEANKTGFRNDLSVSSMLIEMYGKCGSTSEARAVFDKLSVRDAVLWTAMIKAYSDNHEANKALQCFEEMQEQRVKPDSVTFICLLTACSHASLVLRGQDYFKLMNRDHGVQPTLEHYACMVDLLARSGYVLEAEKLVAAMKCSPSVPILLALLSACKIYGKLEIGERCFQQLLEVNGADASAYLLMADMYASAGKWNDASKLEEMRKDSKSMKKPGNALIEVNQKSHEFVVGQPREDIANMWKAVTLQMKGQGFIPNVDSVLRHVPDDKEVMLIDHVDRNLKCLTVWKSINKSGELIRNMI